MQSLLPDLEEPAASFWRTAQQRLEEEGASAIPVIFPALGRRVGRTPLGGGLTSISFRGGRDARIDRDAWRLCDAAGHELLRGGALDDDGLIDLYLHGDLEERLVLLRALGALPISAATLRILEEVQRTNMESHFHAAVCGSNLAIRALEGPGFDQDAFNRLLLKAAFLGAPLGEMIDATEGANPELSRMLQDLATEREAAGRGVWPDTARMIAHAPCEGTLARLIGGLEHGDDKLRLAAAEGLAHLGREDVVPYARERMDREPRPAIRDALKRCL